MVDNFVPQPSPPVSISNISTRVFFFFLAVLVFCVAINKYLRLGDLQKKEVYFGVQFWFTSMVLGSASGEGFRELIIMVEGEGRASVSHGEKGSKRKRRTFQALLNSQILCELV